MDVYGFVGNNPRNRWDYLGMDGDDPEGDTGGFDEELRRAYEEGIALLESLGNAVDKTLGGIIPDDGSTNTWLCRL